MKELAAKIKHFWQLYLKAQGTRAKAAYGREHRRLLQVWQKQRLIIGAIK